MKLLTTLRDRLGWKLFFSYLVIIVVSALVLVATAEYHAPTVLQRHIVQMQSVLGDNPVLAEDLRHNFDEAIRETMAIAIILSIVVAFGVSLFVTRRIVGPVQVMMRASNQIAAGKYKERIPVPSNDELGALAGSFNLMAEKLEQTEQRRLDLIGNVAHELRTPLSSIHVTMEGIVDGVLPVEAETFLGIQREVSRLQRLVLDLEELSRAEAGQIPLEKQVMPVEELIRPAVDRLSMQFDDKEVDLTIYLDRNLPPIPVDSGRITQVLINLLGNALQYTPAGSKVSLFVRRKPRELEFIVQDEGIGIPPQHLPHIFERFYRVDKSRSRASGGSGIGLTIARHLVEAHGGRMGAFSEGEGQGSTFSFTLPLQS